MTRPRTITVAVSDSVGVDGAQWAQRLEAAWPRTAAAVCCDVVTLDILLARAELDCSGNTVGATGPALAVLGPEVTRAETCRLLDRLHGGLVPVVVLTSTEEQANCGADAGGVVIDKISAPADRIATLLFALGERQEVVRKLAQELRVSNASHGGMRGEMERLREELHQAGAVQRELLPSLLPKVPGLDFSAIFRPVGYVSGDIYDARMIDEHRVAIFIADAVGHGVPAALLTVALRHSLATHAQQDGRWVAVEPAEALSRLNKHLCEREHPVQRFATAVFGHVDVRTRRVTLAGAGHPPPLLFGAGGMERIETDGPLLGVFREADFNQVSFVVEPGQTLVMHTDGFESVFPEGNNWASGSGRFNHLYVERLGAMARQAHEAGSTLDSAMQTMAQYLDTQAGSLHQLDDVTALAMSVPVAAELAKAA